MNDEITPDDGPHDASGDRTAMAARGPLRSTTTAAVSIGTAFALGFVGLGYAAAADPATAATHTQAQTHGQGLTQPPYGDAPWNGGASAPDLGQQDTSVDAADATTAQERGLVYINTVVDYGQGEGAGTGMVLTSNGTILTNHHVIEGATSISVEVLGTGRRYEADLVGYDDTADVAVLQLQGASGLDTVDIDDSGAVEVGDEVTAVGNANGDGGAASAAAGTVTALEQSITASTDSATAEAGGEQLTGLIEVDADVISGDSGGALYDEDGEVVAMTTAASSGAADITGYAVPIEDALAVADQIEAGDESGTVEIGVSGFLGVQLSPQSSQPVVVGTVEDSAAQEAGLSVGSTITSIDGTDVSTVEDVQASIAGRDAGDRVTISWVDASGQQQSATVTLGSGPVG